MDMINDIVNDMKQVDPNGTYMPAVHRVEFSTFCNGGSDGRDVLRTKVFFTDGTFVNVVNSAADKIDLVKATQKSKPTTVTEPDADGKPVKRVVSGETDLGISVASDVDKERAVLYAIVKRLSGDIRGNGEVTTCGLGNYLRRIVRNGVDTNVRKKIEEIEAEKEKTRREAKAKKKAEKKARKAAREAAKAGNSNEMSTDVAERLISTLDRVLAVLEKERIEKKD